MHEFDVVIIGGGLAGLTAGLYGRRYGLSTLVLEASVPGGHLISIEGIEGFPGFAREVPGYELCPIVQDQAAQLGAEFQMSEVRGLEAQGRSWSVITHDERIGARAVIVATGSSGKQLGIPGEARLRNKGVSECASCDGPLFSGQVVGVVGGGDSALEEALTLAKHAAHVIIFNRSGRFSGQHVFQERIANDPKINARHHTRVEEVLGDDSVRGVRARDVRRDEESEVALSGLFVYIGLTPNTSFLKGVIRLSDSGHLLTDGWMRTERPGLFAAGSVRQDSAGQAITSAADGAVAAIAAHRFLTERCEQC